MTALKRIFAWPATQRALGAGIAAYLRLVRNTTRFVIDPPNIYDIVEFPAILAVWHGQHFMMPFLKRENDRGKVLISRHRDGEINAIVAERLGVGTIRGSGAHGGDFRRKGGVTAFNEMLAALAEGYNVAMTADIPKVARVSGLGVVKLAQYSGRPIYPIGIATQRRIQLDNWDRSAINLPFGRLAFATTDPVRVPREVDDATLETLRQTVEDRLNTVTARAYEIADGQGSKAGG